MGPYQHTLFSTTLCTGRASVVLSAPSKMKGVMHLFVHSGTSKGTVESSRLSVLCLYIDVVNFQ